MSEYWNQYNLLTKEWLPRANLIVESMANYSVSVPGSQSNYLPFIYMDLIISYIQSPIVLFLYNSKKELIYATLDNKEWYRLHGEPIVAHDEVTAVAECTLDKEKFSIYFANYSIKEGTPDYLFMGDGYKKTFARLCLLFEQMKNKITEFSNFQEHTNFQEHFFSKIQMLETGGAPSQAESSIVENYEPAYKNIITEAWQNALDGLEGAPLFPADTRKDWENAFLVCRYPSVQHYEEYRGFRAGLLYTTKQAAELERHSVGIEHASIILDEQQQSSSDVPMSCGCSFYLAGTSFQKSDSGDEQYSTLKRAEEILYDIYPDDAPEHRGTGDRINNKVTLYPIHVTDNPWFVVVHIRRSGSNNKGRVSGWRSNYIFHEKTMKTLADRLRRECALSCRKFIFDEIKEGVENILQTPGNTDVEIDRKIDEEIEQVLLAAGTFFPYGDFLYDGKTITCKGLPVNFFEGFNDRLNRVKKAYEHARSLTLTNVADLSISNILSYLQELDLHDDGFSNEYLRFSHEKITTIQTDEVNTRTPSQILNIIGANLIYPYTLGFIGASLLVGTLMSQKTGGFFPTVMQKSNQQAAIDRRCIQMYKIFLLGAKPASNIYHDITKVAGSASNSISPFVNAGYESAGFLDFYSTNNEKKVHLISDQISECADYLLQQFSEIGLSTKTINNVARKIDGNRIDGFIARICQERSLWKTR